MYPTAHAISSRRPAALLFTGLLVAAGMLTACSHHRARAGDAASAKGVKAAAVSPNGFRLNHEDWAKVGYRLDWVGFPFAGGDEGTQVTMIKAFDDLVIIQDRQSTVAALETNNGQTRWSAQLAGPLTKFVGINRDPDSPGMVLVSSESEVFGISAANGNIMDRERFARVINTQPVLAGNMLIAGTSTGEMIAHALGRNVKAWGFATVGAIEANPVPMAGEIAAVSQAGDIMFLSVGGSLNGRARIYEGLDTNPVTDGSMLFVAGRDRSVWAFDANGASVWRFRTSSPLTTQPTVHNGVLYVDIPSMGLTAFEAVSGRVLWNSPNVNGTGIGTRSGRLLVLKGQTLTLADAGRGDVVERINTPGIVKIIVDAFDDGRIYAVNDRSNVAKLIPR